ncbi:nucleoside triphosphate pyrophosphatase [Pseudoroseomonas cervicalis]|uniref:Maf family protein n=1 Tax=Teichococcus cervicalis TaxID=204525 RepID=UPI002785A682|nr:Maf family protein [Pseudoroseomonas cervicalis]MDQ1080938.1 septum formation protein [Pseudoroseomonas cervicalis]
MSVTLILASSSETRAALLRGAGLEFEARPARVDEAALKQAAQAEAIPPGDAAILLAEAKAQRIARQAPEAVVIGADQLLVCEGRWYDKPEDIAAARAQLQALRGRSHTLHTATVAWRGGQRIWQHLATPRLTMRGFSDAFLERYLAAEGEAVTWSVGAYRLEGLGVQLFRDIQGEHSAILGLPLLPLLGFLRQHGVLEE